MKEIEKKNGKNSPPETFIVKSELFVVNRRIADDISVEDFCDGRLSFSHFG